MSGKWIWPMKSDNNAHPKASNIDCCNGWMVFILFLSAEAAYLHFLVCLYHVPFAMFVQLHAFSVNERDLFVCFLQKSSLPLAAVCPVLIHVSLSSQKNL